MRVRIHFELGHGGNEVLVIHSATSKITRVVGTEQEVELVAIQGKPPNRPIHSAGDKAALLGGSAVEQKVVLVAGRHSQFDTVEPKAGRFWNELVGRASRGFSGGHYTSETRADEKASHPDPGAPTPNQALTPTPPAAVPQPARWVCVASATRRACSGRAASFCAVTREADASASSNVTASPRLRRWLKALFGIDVGG